MASRDPQTPRRRGAGESPAARTVRQRRGSRQPPDPLDLFAELQGILAEPRPPEALKRGLVAVERFFHPRSAWVVVHDAAFDRLNVAAARGRADPRVQATAPGEGPVGTAFSTGKPVTEGPIVAVPMRAFGNIVGVLVLLAPAFEGEEGPTLDELSRIEAVANACGAACEVARTRNDAERRARELETAAERLREGDQTRDAILSHLSHELRNPLTTIKGYLAMALKGRLGELTERQRNALAICNRSTDRLLRLINDLLLTARLQSGKMTLDPRPLGLRAVLQEAIEFAHDEVVASGVTIDFSVRSGDVFVRGNRDRLMEAFMHLLERGMRGRRDGERIEVRLAPRGRVGAIDLVLGGVQVPEEQLPRLFDDFRVESGSLYHGLSIARQIFQLHGGHIEAEQLPRGLAFHVALPLFAGVVTGPTKVEETRSGEILIVEDDADCRNGLVEFLEAESFRVRAYADGREALERIQQVPPALVLLDLRLPGVDGAALIKTVREGSSGQHTPIFVISGAIDAGSGTDQAWGERVDGVFEKPINFPYLLERVREFVAPAEAGS